MLYPLKKRKPFDFSKGLLSLCSPSWAHLDYARYKLLAQKISKTKKPLKT